MKKVMVFNFETMQYEQATEAEGKEWVGLIESMNADCAAQHRVQRTSACCRAEIIPGIREGEPDLCSVCGGTCR